MAKKQGKKSAGNDVRGVDLVEVERILAFMEKHGLEEFEFEGAGTRIKLRKAFSGGAAPARVFHPVETHAPVAVHAAPAASSAPSAAKPAEAQPASDLHLIKSPIVGTFYSAPSPGAAAFVTRGGKVDSGQVLCIIEAMKLMNEIESDVAGEVVEVFVENGSPVEYGQPLFGIRAQGKK